MNWLIFALASAIFFTFSGLFQKTILKEKEVDPVALAIVFQLVVALILLPIVFNLGFPWPSSSFVYPRIIAMGIIYTFGAFFWFKAVKSIPISEATIISSTNPFWTLLGSSLFLGELINSGKILGIILITLGIIVVYWQKGVLASFGRGQFFALVASALFAIGFLNDFSIVSYFSLPVYLFIGYLFPAIGVVIIQPRAIAKIRPLFNKKRVFLITLLSLISVSGISLVYSAYLVGGEASRIIPVNQSSVVLTVVLAAIFLKERKNLVRKFIGSILVVLGIVFLH